MKKIFFGLIFLFLITPAFVLAEVKCDAVGLNCTAEGNFSNADVSVFVGNIIKAMLALLGVIVLIFMVYGGYLWMMSGGNDQMVKKSKDILINAVIGLVIVLAAYAITTFVVSRIYSAANSSGTATQGSDANPCGWNASGATPDGTVCLTPSGDSGTCNNGLCQSSLSSP